MEFVKKLVIFLKTKKGNIIENEINSVLIKTLLNF